MKLIIKQIVAFFIGLLSGALMVYKFEFSNISYSGFFINLLKILNNTFIGTLLAGVLIGCFGLWIYQRQKTLDVVFSKREKLHELVVSLHMHVNVAVRDFKGQVSVYDGTNLHAKALLDKMNSLSPGYQSSENSKIFVGYISNINKTFNELIAFLELNVKYKSETDCLIEQIPSLNLLLSFSGFLEKLSTANLKEVLVNISTIHDKIESSLKSIIR